MIIEILKQLANDGRLIDLYDKAKQRALQQQQQQKQKKDKLNAKTEKVN
ncbi:hypothetical protein BLA29_001573 [Euroglyphus maynei]|uniref:Uncharacterized protein n=1 Tax=Euroglyphus maynei TaxID=6958 RepID=A0A1Y3BN23_EURMA|nr:hypothetical protein BLA29_001573 [Euroglyphus maynei]